jgi:uridine kinase
VTGAGGARAAVLGLVADAVAALPAGRVRRIGVDGVDGAGKTVFADELAAVLAGRGHAVIRASVDAFHQPAAVRHRRGRGSPQGYFHDSYDYEALARVLLDPLLPAGSGRIVRRIHDVHREAADVLPVERADAGAVLVFDGIFLHRPELVAYWDRSVYLDVPFAVSIPRGAQRGYGDPDPAAPSNRRYVEGQRLYLRRCAPRDRVSFVIDNTDLTRPRVVRLRPRPPGAWRPAAAAPPAATP